MKTAFVPQDSKSVKPAVRVKERESVCMHFDVMHFGDGQCVNVSEKITRVTCALLAVPRERRPYFMKLHRAQGSQRAHPKEHRVQQVSPCAKSRSAIREPRLGVGARGEHFLGGRHADSPTRCTEHLALLVNFNFTKEKKNQRGQIVMLRGAREGHVLGQSLPSQAVDKPETILLHHSC